MDNATWLQHLKNKIPGLEALKQQALKLGNSTLYDKYSEEQKVTEIAIIQLDTALKQIQLYTNVQVMNKMLGYFLEELPDLAFYFQTNSIKAAVTDTFIKAFNRVAAEDFIDKVVGMVEKPVTSTE